jgi:hypothetical protein
MHSGHPCLRHLVMALLAAMWVPLPGCGGALAGGKPVATALPLEVDPPRSPRGGDEAGWIAAVHDVIHGARAIDLVRGDLREAGAPRRVGLEIRVEPDGRIEDVVIAEPSAVESADDRARAIFTRVGALPAPPAPLHSDDGVTRLRWRLAPEQRGCGEEDARVVRVLDPTDETLARLLRAGRHAEAATRLLGEIDRGALPETQARRLAREVLAVAAESDADASARTAALLALARAGDRRAVPGLLLLLRVAAPEAACAAALLAALRAREAIPDLEAALRRNDPATNVPLALALRALGNPEAATVLLPALRDPRPDARLAALRAMAALPSTAQTGGVAALLADRLPAVRHQAARVLGLIGGSGAAASLVHHAAHASAADRAAAVRALGVARSGGPAARWAIEAALRDHAPEVRAAARAAFARITPTGDGRPLAQRASGAGVGAPASRAAPERSADQASARAALLEIAAARGPQRLQLAARQLPARHACLGADAPGGCGRADDAPACGATAAGTSRAPVGGATVALVGVE